MPIEAYAAAQLSELLERLGKYARALARRPNAEKIHSLRIALRRTLETLRVFKSLFPSGQVKKTRRRLKRLLAASGEVRDRDIALDLLKQAGASGHALHRQIASERRTAVTKLQTLAAKWDRRFQSGKVLAAPVGGADE
jgi:CHAD domain-containing protein